MEKGLGFAKKLTSIRAWAIAASVLLLSVPGHGNDCLKGALEALTRTVEDTRTAYVSPEVRARVKEIFSDSSLTQRQRARQAFELILEARLRLIPAAQAEAVRAVYRHVEFLPDMWFTRSSYYNPTNNLIMIYMARELEESLPYFMTMTHELEHSLQYHMMFDRTRKGLSSQAQKAAGEITTLPHATFLKELGAMRAEWAFLNAIPEEVRLQAAEDIRSRTEGLPGAIPRMWMRCFKNASCDVDTYIAQEHSTGRYSAKKAEQTATLNAHRREAAIEALQKDAARNESAARATLAAGAIFLSAQALCEFMVNYEEAHPNVRQTFSRICSQLPGREEKR